MAAAQGLLMGFVGAAHVRIVNRPAVCRITHTGWLSNTDGRELDSTKVLAGAGGGASSKGLRVHAPMVFRSPKKSFANASEFFATRR